MKYFLIIISAFVVLSCKDKGNYSKISSQKLVVSESIHKIVVDEMKDGGSYAYINVTEDGNKYWMAIPNTDVKIGGTYYYDGGMIMKDFESEHLNKTFKSIIFAEGIRETEKMIQNEVSDPHVNSTTENSNEVVVNIEQPKGGISLETLFSKKESFENKSITVKGKIVKVNNGILDKNWIHIVDGTQFENEKNLTVTTLEVLKVGDTVTFKGVIALKKDFGYGYVYDILLEEGELIK
tara:strand:+ start:241 stop:951 length:711 start_codon:yes stop_codon:yes gene_type:complete